MNRLGLRIYFIAERIAADTVRSTYCVSATGIGGGQCNVCFIDGLSFIRPPIRLQSPLTKSMVTRAKWQKKIRQASGFSTRFNISLACRTIAKLSLDHPKFFLSFSPYPERLKPSGFPCVSVVVVVLLSLFLAVIRDLYVGVA
jgi:hypothetical protein